MSINEISLEDRDEAMKELTTMLGYPFLSSNHDDTIKESYLMFHNGDIPHTQIGSFGRKILAYSQMHSLISHLSHEIKNPDLNLEIFPKEARVLEIGCNYGAYLYFLSHARPDLNLTGVDISDHAVEYGTQRGNLNLKKAE